MEWREDVGPARAGDAGARERLREYLTPFAHGVALASAPHHVTERLVPRILDEAMRSLGGVDDDSVGVHVMNVARRMAKEATPGAIEEQGSSQGALLEARQSLSRLRSIPEQARERFFLRLVEGIPGPELAQVARVAPGELRAELERAAAEAARAFGQGQSFAGDEYLWELSGSPPPLLARLEMQLPLLRFDPTAAPLTAETSAGTFQELQAVGGTLSPRGASSPIKPLLFEEFEGTETGVVTAPVPAATRPPPLDVPNPFEPQVRTIAATDLPAEARGSLPMVPWSLDSAQDPGKSGKQQALPPRPVPVASPEGERSGKSNSGKSNSNKSGKNLDGSKSGRLPPMPPRSEVTKDAPKLDDPDETQAKVPALVLAAQAEIVTSPESGMLGKPTMMLPLSAAVTTAPPSLTHEETRVGGVTAPTPQASVLDAPVLQGGQPLFLALGLAVVGLVIYSTSIFAAERNARANWQLTQVVVAAEELGVGDTVTLENVALRSVPEPYHGSGVVKGDMMDFILDQKLAVGVQMGDPLFMSQFVSMRTADQRLSKKVLKRARGFTIAVNAVSAVGRWVKPGDLVDVLVTFPGKDGPRKQVERRAVTLLQKVPVLATGKVSDALGEATMDEREKAYVDVTLLLSPEEAEALTLGATLGRVKLTLRNADDLEEDRNLDGAYTDSDTLLDGERQKVVRSKRQKIIQIIRAAANPQR
ncbi:MAG: Flp pilus assembly protein CpaB [Archangium sp.]|nr:Flp pilus assembly protein CpaB [Archangium sp.]